MAGEFSAVTHVIMDMDGVLLGNEIIDIITKQFQMICHLILFFCVGTSVLIV